ncbi:response regulator [Patescibacteria group bacterium]
MERKIKILIIDDDEAIREMYVKVFKKSNFDVHEASDGIEGLDMATKKLPDIIFTGIVMPRMDGFSLMEALQKNIVTSTIPVIINSHMGREEDQEKADKLGAKDFIVKGMTAPEKVVDIINSLFTGKGEYRLEFDPYALDAKKIVKELGISKNFQCGRCNTTMALKLRIKNKNRHIFAAQFYCPKCGVVAKFDL